MENSSAVMENITISSETTYHEELETIKETTKTQLFVLIFEYVQAVEYLLCFLANVLTITAVVKFDYLHKKSTNILILSLSVADGLLGK